MRKKYRPFKEARRFARSLGLKSYTEWTVYRKSTKKPDDIPTDPRSIYSKEFQGYPDFLATGNIANKNRKFLPYQKARQYVHKLGLKDTTMWKKFCKSGKLPKNIPKDPNKSYANKGWTHMRDWLGTSTYPMRHRKYRTFEDARRFIHRLKLRKVDDWYAYCKSGKKPDDIPSDPRPRRIFKGKFEGWQDWLGPLANHSLYEKLVPFSKVRKYVRSLHLDTEKEWHTHYQNNELPFHIPAYPDSAYKKKGWKGYPDFLGSGRISSYELGKNMLTYPEAEKAAHILVNKLGIKTHDDWHKAWQEGKIPKNLPAKPWFYYTPSKRIKK